jgi:hypothetical protein
MIIRKNLRKGISGLTNHAESRGPVVSTERSTVQTLAQRLAIFPSRKMLGEYLKLGHDLPFVFINQPVIRRYSLESELLTVSKMTVLWDAASRSLVEIDRRFGGAYCLHHQGDHRLFIVQ